MAEQIRPEPPRRRRRVRHPAVTEAPISITADADDLLAVPVIEAADTDAGPVERGLRGLVGGGSSQVKPSVAMRARDAARPRPADLARAEAELVIVRRHWTPRD